jgi:hypothetical protein
MELIENEAVELGADDLEAMALAFGHQHRARVERFYEDFYTTKNKMKRRLPATLEKLSAQTRSEVHAAVMEFLTNVKCQGSEHRIPQAVRSRLRQQDWRRSRLSRVLNSLARPSARLC